MEDLMYILLDIIDRTKNQSDVHDFEYNLIFA